MPWLLKPQQGNKRGFMMRKTLLYVFVVSLLGPNFVWAQKPAAVAKPEEISMEALLASEQPAPSGKSAVKAQKKAAKKQAATEKKAAKVASLNAKKSPEDPLLQGTQPVAVPNANAVPVSASTQPIVASVEETVAGAVSEAAQPTALAGEEEKITQEEPSQPDFVAPRETVQEQPVVEKKPKVVYNPTNHRDPTLSPDDFLLLQHREQQRLAAIEAERRRKLEEERRAKEEAERLRLLELERIKDPTREVRNKIKVGGIIGQEVFIGSKIYTVGKSIYGARIVEIRPEEVVFSYKGHKFVRKVQLN